MNTNWNGKFDLLPFKHREKHIEYNILLYIIQIL